MKKETTLLLCIAFMAIASAMCDVNASEKIGTASIASIEEETYKRPRNEIRFAGWGEKEWSDNEYIRSLRKHIDAHNNKEVRIDNFIAYKEIVKGKFVIYYIEPAIYGGAYILFFFIDNPSVIFDAWVYSYVDEVKYVVTKYEIRSVNVFIENSGLTKEQVLKDLETNPEIKVW